MLAFALFAAALAADGMAFTRVTSSTAVPVPVGDLDGDGDAELASSDGLIWYSQPGPPSTPVLLWGVGGLGVAAITTQVLSSLAAGVQSRRIKSIIPSV